MTVPAPSRHADLAGALAVGFVLGALAGTAGPRAALAAAVGGGIVLAGLWRRAGPRGYVPAGRDDPDPALDAALAARHRRDLARDLARRDPLLALELRVGRPDLSHGYDDGGLVDLAGAPAEFIAAGCRVDAGLAEELAAVCAPDGGVRTVPEALALIGVEHAVRARILDRAIVLGG